MGYNMFRGYFGNDVFEQLPHGPFGVQNDEHTCLMRRRLLDVRAMNCEIRGNLQH